MSATEGMLGLSRNQVSNNPGCLYPIFSIATLFIIKNVKTFSIFAKKISFLWSLQEYFNWMFRSSDIFESYELRNGNGPLVNIFILLVVNGKITTVLITAHTTTSKKLMSFNQADCSKVKTMVGLEK